MSNICQHQKKQIVSYSHLVRWLFGEYIKRFMDKRGMTLGDLSKVSGISKGNLSYYINGERSDKLDPPNPTTETLLVLARALRVPPENLLKAYQGIDPDATDVLPATPTDPDVEVIDALEMVLEKMRRKSKRFQQPPSSAKDV